MAVGGQQKTPYWRIDPSLYIEPCLEPNVFPLPPSSRRTFCNNRTYPFNSIFRIFILATIANQITINSSVSYLVGDCNIAECLYSYKKLIMF